MLAVKGGSVQAVALLLNSGVNPFQKNGMGQSALDISRTMKREDLISAISQAVQQWEAQLAPDQIVAFNQQ